MFLNGPTRRWDKSLSSQSSEEVTSLKHEDNGTHFHTVSSASHTVVLQSFVHVHKHYSKRVVIERTSNSYFFTSAIGNWCKVSSHAAVFGLKS